MEARHDLVAFCQPMLVIETVKISTASCDDAWRLPSANPPRVSIHKGNRIAGPFGDVKPRVMHQRLTALTFPLKEKELATYNLRGLLGDFE